MIHKIHISMYCTFGVHVRIVMLCYAVLAESGVPTTVSIQSVRASSLAQLKLMHALRTDG